MESIIESVGDPIVTKESHLRNYLAGALVTVYGHSMTFSDSMSLPGVRWGDRLKNRLNLGWVLELGQNGSSLHDIANFMIGNGYPARTFTGFRGIHLIQAGVLEILYKEDSTFRADGSGLSARQKLSIEENLRAIGACIMGALGGARDEISAATGWTMSGVWTSANHPGASAGTHIFTTVLGNYAQKVLAAGTYWVHLISTEPAALPFAMADISVGGVMVHDNVVTEASWDSQGLQALDFGHVARKIVVPEGDAAARTVRISHAGPDGTYMVLDCVAAELASPPLGFFIKEYWTGNSNGEQTQAAADYSEIFDAVTAEFPLLPALDISEGWDFDLHVGQDLVHPNDAAQWLLTNNLILELSKHITGWNDRLHYGESVLTTVEAGTRLSYARTGSFTFEFVDRDFFIKQTSASATTATVPSATEIPIGTKWEVWQWGAGQVTISPQGGGVNLRGPKGFRSAGQYARIVVEKLSATDFYVSGDVIV